MGYFAKRVTIEYKGDVDLVTEADRASEKLIVERLQARWPEHGIVGEEGTRSETEADYRWYVDPLDGTTNFAHGYPVFCVSIALVRQDGQLEVGVLYDPTRDEMFSAERGNGATLEWQEAPGIEDADLCQNPFSEPAFQVTSATRTPTSTSITSSPCARTECAAPVQPRSTSPTLPADATTAFWEFNLNPWDTAAGVLIVQEAGGTVTRFDGTPFRLDSREVLASNGLIHEELLQNFAEMFAGRGFEELPSVAEYVKTRHVALGPSPSRPGPPPSHTPVTAVKLFSEQLAVEPNR